MKGKASIRWIAFSAAAIATAGWVGGQSPSIPVKSPAKGVRCPAEFEAIWDADAKVLRCRKQLVSWVVTGCPDKGFATYVVKSGPDTCGPTEIPGVGTPPGAKGSRAVSCAAPGYDLMNDRTRERDRCERIEKIFALPLPAS